MADLDVGMVVGLIKALGSLSGGGSGGGGDNEMLVGLTYSDVVTTLDKTWREIHDAVNSGVSVYINDPYNISYDGHEYSCYQKYRVNTVVVDNFIGGGYVFAVETDCANSARMLTKFHCNAPDEYPNNSNN